MSEGSGPTRKAQHHAVAAVLDALDGFASAREVHEALVRSGSTVALATVYRNLHALSAAGRLDAVYGAGGEVRYCALGAPGDRHLACRSCGYAVEIPGAPVEEWAKRVGGEHDFDDVTAVVEMSGTCSTCPAAPAPDTGCAE